MEAPVVYVDRVSGRREVETIAGEKWIRFLYENPLGRPPLHLLFRRKFFSAWMGRRMDSAASAKRIPGFIRSLNIDMADFELPAGGYASFNEFFTRRLKPGARPVNGDPAALTSPGDGRLLAHARIEGERAFQIKGISFDLRRFLGSDALAREYRDGALLVLRLCPSDYHRFHFPDSGVPGETRDIPGGYFSVSPVSLRKIPEVYCRNRRALTAFDSDHFGPLLLIDVGATAVGRIRQTFRPRARVEKGEERGFFAFGGSTTAVLFREGRVKFDQDLADNTGRGLETLVRMGERIGSSP